MEKENRRRIRYYNLMFGYKDQHIAIVPKNGGMANFVMLGKNLDTFVLYTKQISESDIPENAQQCEDLVRKLAPQNSGRCEQFYSLVSLRMSDTYMRNWFVLDRLISRVPGAV